MNKKICFFCVGTGGHVLPVKNLVIKLIDLGVKPDDIIVVTDDRGKQYLKNLDCRKKNSLKQKLLKLLE